MVSRCLLLPTLWAPWGISQPDPPAVYLILDTFIASVLGPHRLKEKGRGRETTDDSASGFGITGLRMPMLAVTCLIWPGGGGGGFGTTQRLSGFGALWGVEVEG